MDRSYEEKSFGEILGVANTHYEVPFFQRGYVWNSEKWKELLNDVLREICDVDIEVTTPSNRDIRSACEQMMKIENNTFQKILENKDYYFGTIYLQNKQNIQAPGDLSRFLIIDGQQRLITIYLFLMKIYYDLYRQNAYERQIVDSRHCLFNRDNKLKIFTLKRNDQDLLETIGRNYDMNRNVQSNIADFGTWYRRLFGSIEPIAKYRLFQLLANCLKITQIILSERDDPMLIFENLNDKGTPLTGDELLCNYIFQPLVEHKDEKEIAKIHEKYWLKPYMDIQQMNIQSKGTKIKQNERYLFFLRTWFSIGRPEMIGKEKSIYHAFKKEHSHQRNDNSGESSKQMLEKLEDIKSHVPLFQEAIAPREYGIENKDLISILQKIDKLKIYTSLTFLMPLLKEWKEKPDFLPELLQILQCVYVFLVRRSLAGLKTTLDNVLFPRLWEHIKDNSDKVEKIKEILRDKELFVTDEALRDRLISVDFYANPLGETVLEEIDKYIVDKTMRGEYPDYAYVNTKEHILPQSFDKNKEWKEYLSKEYQDDPRYTQVLDSRLNTIGNLMLVGGKRNSASQNDIFSKKLEKYEPNTGLSKDLLKNYEEKTWNAETIEERSKKLATVVSKIWSWDIT